MLPFATSATILDETTFQVSSLHLTTVRPIVFPAPPPLWRHWGHNLSAPLGSPSASPLSAAVVDSGHSGGGRDGDPPTISCGAKEIGILGVDPWWSHGDGCGCGCGGQYDGRSSCGVTLWSAVSSRCRGLGLGACKEHFSHICVLCVC